MSNGGDPIISLTDLKALRNSGRSLSDAIKAITPMELPVFSLEG